MDRFGKKPKTRLNRAWHCLSVIFAVFFILFFIGGTNIAGSVSKEEQAKNLEISLRRSIAQCYAIEGTYPPSLDYLVRHYGFNYDADRFFIDYIALGSNIMPDITVLPKYGH